VLSSPGDLTGDRLQGLSRALEALSHVHTFLPKNPRSKTPTEGASLSSQFHSTRSEGFPSVIKHLFCGTRLDRLLRLVRHFGDMIVLN